MKRLVSLRWAIDPAALLYVPAVDASQYQTTIDWPTVAASGVQVAIIRTGHSLKGRDTMAVRNLAYADRAGLAVVGYWYVIVRLDQPAAECARVDALQQLAAVAAAGTEVRVWMVDLEHDQNPAVDIKVREWLRAYSAALPASSVFYGPEDMVTPARVIGDIRHDVIVPTWPNKDVPVTAPAGQWATIAADYLAAGKGPRWLSDWVGWQWHNHGIVPGIPRPVDLNVLSYSWCKRIWPEREFPYVATAA